ncbi:MAG: integrase arm-type DNA-binding domain-containing protein [Sphingomonadales bacterium]|nr:integrase arm-type DNA-binding domain-containing protein [Sphingomonadales bacterium]MDE2170938.1 integrase arm-type DNA-binding domain-containing protein [Sphingomonadales bacterium]
MLTDAACRKAKPSPDGKERKLPDTLGLYLAIKPIAYKVWRFKYRFASKEKKLVIGPYPDVSLSEARAERDKARELLRNGVDPSVDRKQRKVVALAEALDTFELLARAWHRSRLKSLEPRYAKDVLSRLEKNVFPDLGSLPIKQITPPMVLAVLRKVEGRDANEMAHRIRGHMSDVFVWAISSGLAEQDPAGTVRKAMMPSHGRQRPALLEIEPARELLHKIISPDSVYWATRLSSMLLALTAARPGVVRLAERGEFENLDGPAPLWRIPAAKMKLTRERKGDATFEFLIPLAPQAVEVVKAAMMASRSTTLLFPGVVKLTKPISDSTMSKLYREYGYTGQHVPHGWRSTFSTIVNRIAAEQGRQDDREIIDLMLAHVPEGVEPIYNRYLYMPRRRELALEWADMVTKGLPPAASLIPA